ncbi:hypothetical protein KEM55_002027 [Ascosphaera atra]|nr:hypothetical protein KEM55_002027 [Ascosphaera atra]
MATIPPAPNGLPSKFFLVVAGRPLLSYPEERSADPTSPPHLFFFNFPAFPAFSHLTVLLNPEIPLPNGFAAGIYIAFTNETQLAQAKQGSGQGAMPDYSFLGALTGDKQSAVFRVRMPSSTANGNALRTEQEQEDLMMDVDMDQAISANASGSAQQNTLVSIGIQIEPVQDALAKQANVDRTRAQAAERSAAASGAGTPIPPPASRPAIISASMSDDERRLSVMAVGKRVAENMYNYTSSFARREVGGSQDIVPLDTFPKWWEKFEKLIANDPDYFARD